MYKHFELWRMAAEVMVLFGEKLVTCEAQHFLDRPVG